MTLKDIILAGLEGIALQVIDNKSDEIVEKALAALVKLIPGQIDDVLAAKYKEELKLLVKAELLKSAAKIDGVV
jgi:hypothetical protein